MCAFSASADIDGCIGHACAIFDAGATCDDVEAPGTGYSCTCSTGYTEDAGTCQGGATLSVMTIALPVVLPYAVVSHMVWPVVVTQS